MRVVSKPILLLGSMFILVLMVSFAQAQSATQPAGAPPATLPVGALVATQPAVSVTESPAQTATLTAGSAAQLKLKHPLLGMQLMETDDAPNFYQGLTLGGGELYIALGGNCVAGYTNALASLGMVWIGSSGPLQVGFNATDPAVPTATIMWDSLKQQWWCNQQFSPGNALNFQNVTPGVYFLWALTQTSQTVQGNMFVRAAPAP